MGEWGWTMQKRPTRVRVLGAVQWKDAFWSCFNGRNSWVKVQGSGFRVLGSVFRVQGSGLSQ